jgi:hypothetical protein
VHEDFVRLQSTVARIVHASDNPKPADVESWLLDPLADSEAQQDVLAHLSGWRFGACASALGWAEYLRKSHENRAAVTPKDELTRIYERLAGGRAAIANLASLEYRPHNIASVVGYDVAHPPLTSKLPSIDYCEARREAIRRSGDDD